MFRNYLKIAFRHLRRHKGITAINVTGLAIGMACCILIMLFIKDELSFDNFHANRDNIYRVNSIFIRDGKPGYGTSTQFPVGPNLKTQLGHIKQAVRIMEESGNLLFSYGDKRFNEERIAYVDEDFFRMFSFPLLSGNPATALKEPYTVVLTESIARKYFGKEDPIGKILRINNEMDCRVTALAKDMPRNSDLRYDILLSFSTFQQLQERKGEKLDDAWFWWSSNSTYVQLPDHVQPDQLNAQLKALVDRHMTKLSKETGTQFAYALQPLRDIHLHPDGDPAKSQRTRVIYIYVAIGLFIILIGCVNFMNLATARAGERAMEVGLRKVMGAPRKNLMWQFLSEAVLLSGMAFVLSLVFAQLLLPAFNNITDKSLQLFSWWNLPMLGALLLAAMLTGLLAGSYPAFYLSRFVPIATLKGTFQTLRGKAVTRQVLVISQFTIAIILIVSTIVVYTQLRYWQQKSLGFDREHLVNIFFSSRATLEKGPLLKAEMLQLPGVKYATLSNMALGRFVSSFMDINKAGDDAGNTVIAGIVSGDFDLLKTTGVKLLQGRDFSPRLASDSINAYIINEAAVRSLGLKTPVGSTIKGPYLKDGQVIGVVGDFNFETLRVPVRPVVYRVRPTGGHVLTLCLRPGNLHEQMQQINALWNETFPTDPINYSFVSDDLAKLYLREHKLGQLFGGFSVLAICIACMGLFGLSVLIARHRTKEIGIRKVLGASVANITALLTRDFLRLVGVALVVATPVAWYLMSRWLEDFAYRIRLEWWMFVLAGVAAILIALFTIGFQSVKAALMNPVRSLRTE